jgi:hypothetical protein
MMFIIITKMMIMIMKKKEISIQLYQLFYQIIVILKFLIMILVSIQLLSIKIIY